MSATTPERNKEVVRHWIDEGLNKHIDILDEVLDPRVFDHVGGQPGIDWWRMMGQKLETSFPDLHVTIDDIVGEGDRVAVRLTMRATHQGSEMPMLVGVAPTGKPIEWSHIHFFRLEDGRIIEHWAVRDDITMLQQLGVLPSPPKPGVGPPPQPEQT